MRIINRYSCCALWVLLWGLSTAGWAQSVHQHAVHRHTGQQVTVVEEAEGSVQQQRTENLKTESLSMPTHAQGLTGEQIEDVNDHQKQHGGQMYQRTTLESRWLRDEDGNAHLKSEWETWVGSDENKLFVKVKQDKAESELAEYDAKLLYSHMISDYWDLQTGVRYRYAGSQKNDRNHYDVVFGVHGLAPYYFETDAYLLVGQDQYVALSLETERDLLLTQKLILKPYLDVDIVLNDASSHAQKTGLSHVQVGMETRYEISKQLMPFIDVGYAYGKGLQQTLWQEVTTPEKNWFYGAGLRMKF